jgi:hypothetical protein
MFFGILVLELSVSVTLEESKARLEESKARLFIHRHGSQHAQEIEQALRSKCPKLSSQACEIKPK